MRYDLHVHTLYSRCSANSPDSIIKTVNKLKLDGIAIADHNTIQGALKLKALTKKGNFDLIVGEEITTDKGELLAYNINELIKPGKIEDILDIVRQQGAIASLAHPFSHGVWRQKSSITNMDDKQKDKSIKIKKLDAIETFNARCIFSSENKKALKLANSLKLGQTGGSDAHFPAEIGKGLTICKSNILKEIKQKKTRTTGTNKNALFWRLSSLPNKLLGK